MTTNSITYKPAKIHSRAHNRIKEMGFTGREIFEFDNWPEILEYAYLNRDTEKLYRLPKFKNRSATYFQKTGYKHSLVFQKLVKNGGGVLRTLVIVVKGTEIDDPNLRSIVDEVLEHPSLKGLTLSYNVQRGQTEDSTHIHILVFIPYAVKIPQKMKIGKRFYDVLNDVELGKGKYAGQPMKIGVRKLVQYHRFPQDQRYRNWVDGARMQAYREAYETHLDHLDTGQPVKRVILKGVRNMEKLMSALTPAELTQELSEFEEFQIQKGAYRKAKDTPTDDNPYNPLALPQQLPLNTLPADNKPTFQPTPQDITQSIVNSILNYLDPLPYVVPNYPLKTPQINLRI